MSEQAFMMTRRNKKTFGYIYELTLKVEGNLAELWNSFLIFLSVGLDWLKVDAKFY